MKLPFSLESLEVIGAIERKGSFAAAAAILHKVPSAVSYTVQKLEQDLGVVLFQKEGRRAVLTPAGRHLVDQGRTILQAADELAAGTRQIATGWEHRLRIAVDAITPVSSVLPAISKLYEEQPAIEITVVREVLAGTWEALLENRVDLIVGGIGDIPGHRGIQCETWKTVSQCFVAAPTHPICKTPQPLRLKTAEQYRTVIVSDTSRNSTPLTRGIFNQLSVIYVPDMAAKIEAHCQGLGVGYVPRSQVVELLSTGKLLEIKLGEQRQDSATMLGWKTNNKGQALSFLVQQLRKEA